jgi:hypothetical protein
MLSVNEAFDKFRTRLEISNTEEQIASRRQQRLRSLLDQSLAINEDFLTGAYRRETKTKPLRDVDVIIVLDDTTYLDQHPRNILNAVKEVLDPHYGADHVVCDRRAVRIDFGVTPTGGTDDIVSFDVVPGFATGDHYRIPDDILGEWIATNPKVHAEKATTANQNFDGKWKPLVKMIKKWNDHDGSPIEPSFLIEVMALALVTGKWTGSYPYEIRQFFASAADRIDEGWRDPAHLGPDVSDVLDADTWKMVRAKDALRAAEKACTGALRLDRTGRTGDALDAWHDLFGPLFAKS